MKDFRGTIQEGPGDALRVVFGNEKEEVVVETSLSLAEARAERLKTQPKSGVYACGTCQLVGPGRERGRKHAVGALHALATTEPLWRKRKVSSSKRQQTA